jgi:hypothetical protein
VNVFDLDRALVSDYERFARSFTQIRAPDIRTQIEQIYATNRSGLSLSSVSIRTSSRGLRLRNWRPKDRCIQIQLAYFVSMGSRSDFIAIKPRPLPRPPSGRASR